MANICSDAGCTTNIIKAQRGYKRISFEEQRERLANAPTGAKYSNFCEPCGAGGKGTGLSGKNAGGEAGEHDESGDSAEGDDVGAGKGKVVKLSQANTRASNWPDLSEFNLAAISRFFLSPANQPSS